MNLKYDWENDIVPRIGSLRAVEGGFTAARRGVADLSDSQKVFVKIATDELTKKWIKKEIKAYELLNQAGYRFIPTLLSRNDDRTAMAIELLEDVNFDNHWDKDKLEAVVLAQEELKQYADIFKDDPPFKPGDVRTLDNKWPYILEGNNLDTINTKLKKLGGTSAFTKEQVETLSRLHKDWALREDTLVHMDIRADNFGYDPKTKLGKLIDWNWICLGDPSLDTTPLFISMIKAGFDPYRYHPEKYDRAMIAYVLSYWLDSILEGNEDSSPREWSLRVSQAESIEECVKLLEREQD